MSKLDPVSFALGFGSGVAVAGAGRRLRPVFVELAALGIHLGKLALALMERRRESAEDLWAEINDRVRRKAEVRARVAGNGASDLEAP
jgi:hypothetical protein